MDYKEKCLIARTITTFSDYLNGPFDERYILFDKVNLSPVEKILLYALFSYKNIGTNDDNFVFVSQTTLAQCIGKSREQVNRIFKSVEAKGFISNVKGLGCTCIYFNSLKYLYKDFVHKNNEHLMYKYIMVEFLSDLLVKKLSTDTQYKIDFNRQTGIMITIFADRITADFNQYLASFFNFLISDKVDCFAYDTQRNLVKVDNNNAMGLLKKEGVQSPKKEPFDSSCHSKNNAIMSDNTIKDRSVISLLEEGVIRCVVTVLPHKESSSSLSLSQMYIKYKEKREKAEKEPSVFFSYDSDPSGLVEKAREGELKPKTEEEHSSEEISPYPPFFCDAERRGENDFEKEKSLIKNNDRIYNTKKQEFNQKTLNTNCLGEEDEDIDISEMDEQDMEQTQDNSTKQRAPRMSSKTSAIVEEAKNKTKIAREAKIAKKQNKPKTGQEIISQKTNKPQSKNKELLGFLSRIGEKHRKANGVTKSLIPDDKLFYKAKHLLGFNLDEVEQLITWALDNWAMITEREFTLRDRAVTVSELCQLKTIEKLTLMQARLKNETSKNNTGFITGTNKINTKKETIEDTSTNAAVDSGTMSSWKKKEY
jgi:hypothetical protein